MEKQGWQERSLNMRLIQLIVVLFCLAISNTLNYAHAISLTYPSSESETDNRYLYPLAVLKRVMQDIKVDSQQIKLTPTNYPMSQGRALLELNKNNLDFVWSVATPERENSHYFIDFDLYYGYFGQRVLMTTKSNVSRLKLIRNSCDLFKFSAILGADWPEHQLFKAARLPVTTTPIYDDLFRMLSHGRGDYIPRSLFEFQQELNNHKGLVIVPDKSIYYDAPVKLFYSERAQSLMGKQFEQHFSELAQQGEIKALFYRYNARELSLFEKNYPIANRINALAVDECN